eukprot:5818830-Alexandrium_andersonii.AAC.1
MPSAPDASAMPLAFQASLASAQPAGSGIHAVHDLQQLQQHPPSAAASPARALHATGRRAHAAGALASLA